MGNCASQNKVEAELILFYKKIDNLKKGLVPEIPFFKLNEEGDVLENGTNLGSIQKELIVSCKNLPSIEAWGAVAPIAIMYINKNTLYLTESQQVMVREVYEEEVS
jgi:hypothetical protein